MTLFKLDQSLEEFKLDTGSYPKVLSELAFDTQHSMWLGPYIKEKELNDSWGNPYHYLFIHESVGYFLFSLGEDNAVGGESTHADLFSEASLRQ